MVRQTPLNLVSTATIKELFTSQELYFEMCYAHVVHSWTVRAPCAWTSHEQERNKIGLHVDNYSVKTKLFR